MTDTVIYLTRRNLNTLLSKLDRNRVSPGSSQCEIIKCDNVHPVYPQTMKECRVVAVEDEDYYFDRRPGGVHPADDPDNKK